MNNGAFTDLTNSFLNYIDILVILMLLSLHQAIIIPPRHSWPMRTATDYRRGNWLPSTNQSVENFVGQINGTQSQAINLTREIAREIEIWGEIEAGRLRVRDINSCAHCFRR